MAVLKKRGSSWYYDGYVAGKRIRLSLGKNKERAKAKFAEIEFRLSKGDNPFRGNAPIEPFKQEFLDHVKATQSSKTFTNYCIALNHLTQFLHQHGVKYLQKVTAELLDRFVAWRLQTASRKRRGKTIARSTVNTEIKAVKRFFNRAVELGYLAQSPAKKLRLLRLAVSHPRFFSEEEVSAIMKSEKEKWARDVYTALLFTGMRTSELANLEWDDIDFRMRTIRIRPKEFWKPKGMEERIIPMHPVVFELLSEKPRSSRWVFTKKDGGKLNTHSLDIRFRRLLSRLGIPNASLHTWRHTFASYLMMMSGNIRAVQKLLGHKSIKTTEIYAHLSDRHLHQVVSMLPSPQPVTILVTPLNFLRPAPAQVIENKRVGDAGFEPATSTV